MGERNTAMHNELHSPKIHPYLALAIGAVALSTAAVLVKMTAAPAAVVAFYRMFFSFLIMTPMIVLFYRSEWRVLDRRDWLFCTLSGLFLGMHFILWFESLQYTSVASSVVLVTLQPLFTFVGGYLFFKENVGWKALLGGTLAICGAIVICWGDVQIGGMALFGNALALAGAVMGFGVLVGWSTCPPKDFDDDVHVYRIRFQRAVYFSICAGQRGDVKRI